MKTVWKKNRPILIGVVHLRPLPGSHRWGGNWKNLVQWAVSDARAYESGGADGLILENFGDLPFYGNNVPPETVASMASVAGEVRKACPLPLGFNVLRNDAQAALALCQACQGDYFRVNVHTSAMLTDQGILEGQAAETLRRRKQLGCSAEIWADVHVKHASPITSLNLQQSARDTVDRGHADALIISGSGTGRKTSLDEVQEVRDALPSARILLGSGVTSANIEPFLPWINGVIVGTSLKRNGVVGNKVDPRKVERLASRIRSS